MKKKQPMQVCVLEDNRDRQEAMRDYLADRFHQFTTVFFDVAQAMIGHLKTHLNTTILICLDHDLELKPGTHGMTLDPGTGRDVVNWLASQKPVCPVVFHSTNSSAVQSMQLLLEENGWATVRVVPFGDLEWIDQTWKRAVRNAIVQSAQSAANRKRTRTAS